MAAAHLGEDPSTLTQERCLPASLALGCGQCHPKEYPPHQSQAEITNKTKRQLNKTAPPASPLDLHVERTYYSFLTIGSSSFRIQRQECQIVLLERAEWGINTRQPQQVPSHGLWLVVGVQRSSSFPCNTLVKRSAVWVRYECINFLDARFTKRKINRAVIRESSRISPLGGHRKDRLWGWVRERPTHTGGMR